MELAVLIGGGVLLLIETHEKSKLNVTQMILMYVDSEVDSIRFIQNIAVSRLLNLSTFLQAPTSNNHYTFLTNWKDHKASQRSM